MLGILLATSAVSALECGKLDEKYDVICLDTGNMNEFEKCIDDDPEQCKAKTLTCDSCKRSCRQCKPRKFKSMPNMTIIKENAFDNEGGDVDMDGNYESLTKIGKTGLKDQRHRIAMRKLKDLELIMEDAFADFKGTLMVDVPKGGKLKRIGKRAFYNTTGGNESSVDVVDQADLEEIGDEAFTDSKARIRISGRFPRLMRIGKRAFKDAGTKDSVIDIEIPKNATVDLEAFDGFVGSVSVNADDDDDGLSTLAIAAIATGGVVLVGGTTGCLLFRRRSVQSLL